MDSQVMSVAERRAVRSTYRSLRLGVVALIALLVSAVVTEATRAGCWLDSLSAYYWTGAHDAVVGALCAVGALLVAYTGTDDVEDALLDAAGFLAFVVALTPTERGTGCPVAAAAEVPAALADARTGLSALVLVGLLVAGARAAAALRAGRTGTAVLARVGVLLVVVVPAVGLLVAPDLVVAGAHAVAAVLLFVAVVGVVVLRAFAARAVSSRWAIAYSLLGAAMLLTLAAVVALHAAVPTWAQAVLVLETALVGLFAGYWVLQTVELWGVDVPRTPRARLTTSEPAEGRPAVPR
ncbi:hypothetical protein [Cellulomonas sp. S1-8]|uniref:hypothetical protein n=1 Tax=Cellulomonas sp. S1-8 TaxID=2904790 RepID=UPI002243DBF4|nr:hypothetical protein [Cellulomonas sp. S1-8]UZN01574.1 hypothetical protein OKX07_10665 [Cellulomonas sp. S1-8]